MNTSDGARQDNPKSSSMTSCNTNDPGTRRVFSLVIVNFLYMNNEASTDV